MSNFVVYIEDGTPKSKFLFVTNHEPFELSDTLKDAKKFYFNEANLFIRSQAFAFMYDIGLTA